MLLAAAHSLHLGLLLLGWKQRSSSRATKPCRHQTRARAVAQQYVSHAQLFSCCLRVKPCSLLRLVSAPRYHQRVCTLQCAECILCIVYMQLSCSATCPSSLDTNACAALFLPHLLCLLSTAAGQHWCRKHCTVLISHSSSGGITPISSSSSSSSSGATAGSFTEEQPLLNVVVCMCCTAACCRLLLCCCCCSCCQALAHERRVLQPRLRHK